MEAQTHELHYNHGHDPLYPADLHGEKEGGGETRSAMKKVKDKVHKLKATIKHGHHDHGGEHKDEADTLNNSAVVRSGLAEPTVMGTPVLAEDLYATHSDILDTPVRSFAQWEEEERRGSPPPLSTGYETHLTNLPHHTYAQDVDSEPLEGSIGKPSGSYGTHLTDQSHVGHHAYGDRDVNTEQRMTDSPANLQSEVTDTTTNTGGKEVGITEVLKSFHKMNVNDEPDTDSLASDQKEPNVHTGSHDQFAPQPVENPPLGAIAENPSNRNSSYTQRISSATSAIVDKAATVKDSIVSKLSSPGNKKTNTRSSFPTDFSHKVAGTLSGTLGPVYEKVTEAGSSVISKMQGPGHDDVTGSRAVPEGKGVGVKDYLVNTFKPGDDDKVLSDVITHAFHMRKRQQPPQETTSVIRDEGERRLQDSCN